MKKSTLIFAVCLAALGLRNAGADDADAARAATRRMGSTATSTTSAATTQPSSRQKISKPATTSSTATTATSRATTTAPQKNTTTVTSRATTTVGPRDGNVISESARRTEASVPTGTRNDTVARGATSSRTTSGASRAAITPTRRSTISATPARMTTSAPNRTSARSATTARAADSDTAALRDAIMNRNYTTCRTVYYDCMDEFCANKDSQLKRCACSSRIHEFDNVKKQLATAEDKMLDFSQRLLTVNMDKEDAAALFTATEGEIAFNSTKDTSDSKKILDEISKKLNTGSSDDSFNQSLESISLSLNMDAAFDSVDSLLGASTTTKEGTALYNAALPVCREMAAEVCDEDSLSLAISGYQMAIEQDCTTVSKAYSTQVDQAREKIRESSALLDMSRLDIYQKRNSDNILVCKKKMLTQLSDTSVCGENLGKCLDMTGKYIDPSTGQAFLTNDLADLANLITRPTDNESWTSAPGNRAFAQYLQSKKKYLEPAMENCQDIADDVWDAFLEDALAQIKLAQEAKLEEMRQSCTTLTTQCLADTAKSLSDFDARALSTFGVAADKTVNAMCNIVTSACGTLMATTGAGTTSPDSNEWVGGMTQIATEKTYDTIMQTCREVGRACIIQVCKSVSGNFGLCENMDTSINRKSIINRTACWSEVLQCVQSAGEDSIKRIFEEETKVPFDRDSSNNLIDGGTFYKELYGYTRDKYYPTHESEDAYCEDSSDTNSTKCLYDICYEKCKSNATAFECRTCRLAEKIWGNCEADPKANIASKLAHNKILTPVPNASVSITEQPSTLLSWFATNTGTADKTDNCRDTTCAAGYVTSQSGSTYYCIDTRLTTPGNGSPTGVICKDDSHKIYPSGKSGTANCCGSEDGGYKTIISNNCCETSTISNINTTGDFYSYDTKLTGSTAQGRECDVSGANQTQAKPLIRVNATQTLVCQGGTVVTTKDPNTGKEKFECQNGRYVYVTADNQHIDPRGQTSYMYYWGNDGNAVIASPDAGWGKDAPQAWIITGDTSKKE